MRREAACLSVAEASQQSPPIFQVERNFLGSRGKEWLVVERRDAQRETGDADARDLHMSVKDPERFGAVFERHADSVHRYLSRRVGTTLADELTSETFTTAFQSRTAYDEQLASCRAWLFGIATNLLRHHRRAESRRLAAYQRLDRRPGMEAEDIAVTNRLAASEVLDRALLDLNDDMRDVLMLIGAAGLSYEEAAAALSVPIGTIRSRLFRARQVVRRSLSEWQDNPCSAKEPTP